MSVVQRKIGKQTFAVYVEVANELDALKSRLVEAKRLLRAADIELYERCGPDGNDTFDVMAASDREKFLSGSDSAPAAPTNPHQDLCDWANGLTDDSPFSAPAAPSVCNWNSDWEGAWHTDCGLTWFNEEGTPTQNEMAFCPKCGKQLAEHPYVEPPVCGVCGEELKDGKCPEGCTAETVSEVQK